MTGVTSIRDWLVGIALAVAIAVAVAALLTVGVQRLQLADLRVSLSNAKTAAEKQRGDAATAALAASTKYRALEARMATNKDEAQRELDESKQRGALQLAAERARSQRLSRDIASFAAGGGPTGDSIAACRADAATLGELLDESLRAEEDLVAAAEGHADDVRALLRAWPMNVQTSAP